MRKACSSIFDPCKAGHVTFNAGARTRKMEEEGGGGREKIKHAECYVVKRTCR